MHSIELTPSSLEELLQLGKAAQSTIIMMLKQSSGQYRVNIDRSGMSAAEKQKFKNGLKQLKDKSLISKIEGAKSSYLIDNTRIKLLNKNISKSPSPPEKYSTTSELTTIKATEVGGNSTGPHVSLENLIDQINYKKRVAESREKITQEREESEQRFWSSLERRVKKGTYRRKQLVEAYYTDIEGCDTKPILSACTEFIEEVTNLLYFFDVKNRVKHENELYNRFNRSAWFYNNRRASSDKTNLLVELEEVIRLAKHTEVCVELSKSGKKCTGGVNNSV